MLDVVLQPVEDLYSWCHHLLRSEGYSVCPPSDCANYKIRKDQLLVINPFKWPWSGSDAPQFAASYDEVNQTMDQKYQTRPY